MCLGERFLGSLRCLGCGSSIRTVNSDNELRQIANDLSKSRLLRPAFRLSFTTPAACSSKFLFIFWADLAGLRGGVNILTAWFACCKARTSFNSSENCFSKSCGVVLTRGSIVSLNGCV